MNFNNEPVEGHVARPRLDAKCIPLTSLDGIRRERVGVTVMLPAAIKADLDRYAKVFEATYGKAVEPAELIPYMLATFMARDRAFRSAMNRAAANPENS